MSVRFTGTIAAALAAAVCMAMPAEAQDYFAGKTISFVVPTAPGGSTDTNWRAIAPFFSKHVPGNPTVIIQNMDGGGGNLGRNYVYERARPDGLTLIAAPWNPLGALTGEEGFRVDYTKMELVGGLPDPVLVYTRRDVVEGGMKEAADIMKASNVDFAGQRAGSATDIMSRLTFDILGIEARYIPGYQGAGPRQAAILAGEVDAAGIGYVAYKTSVEATSSDETIALWLHSIGPNPSAPDVIDFPSFHQQVKGAPPSGEKWELLRTVYLATGVFFQSLWAPPGSPPEAIEALREGWAGLMADEEFQQTAVKQFGTELNLVGWEEGKKVVDELLSNPDQGQIDALRAMMAE